MTDKLIGIVSDIVASYVCNNSVPPAEMPNLINSVYKALAAIDAPVAITETASPSQKPTAGQIRKSITPSALISFIDGQPYKMLKRHLTTHGTTPDEYRATFGLPKDYPMTSSEYSQTRSGLAKAAGLGGGGRKKR
jgi:predicted transcriptional regulator